MGARRGASSGPGPTQRRGRAAGRRLFTAAGCEQVDLIEKGAAKLHGSYEALEGGSVEEALRTLTGFPTQRLHLVATDGSSLANLSNTPTIDNVAEFSHFFTAVDCLLKDIDAWKRKTSTQKKGVMVWHHIVRALELSGQHEAARACVWRYWIGCLRVMAMPAIIGLWWH